MKRILFTLCAIIVLASCSRVSGTYVNESGGLYEQIEFIGNTSCNITALGMKYPATYRIDKGYVYIHTHDGADMLFKIQDSNTLVGESFFNVRAFSNYRTTLNSSALQGSPASYLDIEEHIDNKRSIYLSVCQLSFL